MKTKHFALSILGSLILSNSVFALSFGGLDISPTYPNEKAPNNFVFELKPGDTAEEFATITNQTNDPLEVFVYPVDTKINNQKDTVLEDRGESRDLVGKWITMPEGEEYSLNPRESKTIKFVITAPQDAEKKDYIGGVALERKTANGSKEVAPGASIKTNTRVGIRTFVKVTDTPQPVIKMKITPTNDWAKYYLYSSIGFFVIVVVVYAAISLKKKKSK